MTATKETLKHYYLQLSANNAKEHLQQLTIRRFNYALKFS